MTAFITCTKSKFIATLFGRRSFSNSTSQKLLMPHNKYKQYNIENKISNEL